MCITVTEKDLRELHIRRAARVIQFKRACRIRAKTPDKMPLSTLTSLRNLIHEADERIAEFQQDYLR
ncbi:MULTISPECIES: hypothetical protein [Serratia]|uniref:Uncharacterized protein n=1 Tax=Serratia fonticola TaxID=47917 RepID=A0AAW3WV38_SERFO|nr:MULTISPECIES: hypothetical protein [Serratia]ALX97398.1 hypothetical protein AV650_27930 [Serratia fonticola]MBC3214651.1 hypothetical protein [Serratia fonticola]NYA15148.1 hypothetical protein [Serratia fonticola]NYA35392.1 hypothetical protein [Serratia fonticola]OCJ27554.1 hypothetical protein A6U95_28560 [Serratia sp. 14-2641]